MNVLAIGAHPDDIEFGCFGVLAMHRKKGDAVSILVLTQGQKGGDPNIRVSESIEAAALIEATIQFGEFQDGFLRDNHKLVDFIENTIRNQGTDIVYTHVSKDRHQDHRYASLASISGARSAREVFEYETPTAISRFAPQMYADVTQVMGLKEQALKCHKSQSVKRYLEFDAVKGIAKYRAYQAGLHERMAEAFEVARLIR